jgi:hypothetical protein
MWLETAIYVTLPDLLYTSTTHFAMPALAVSRLLTDPVSAVTCAAAATSTSPYHDVSCTLDEMFESVCRQLVLLNIYSVVSEIIREILPILR